MEFSQLTVRSIVKEHVPVLDVDNTNLEVNAKRAQLVVIGSNVSKRPSCTMVPHSEPKFSLRTNTV